MLRGSVAIAVFFVVLAAVVGLHGISPSSADVGDQSTSTLVGKWKPLDARDQSVIEFVSDGSLKITARGNMLEGTYAWTNGDTITLSINANGKTMTETLRIRIDGNVLHTVDSHGKVDKFLRVISQPVAAAQRQPPVVESNRIMSVYASAPPTLSTADLGRPCDDSFHRIPGRLGSPVYQQKKGTVAGSAGFQYDFLEASDTRELQANAEGWGIASGNIDRAKQRRYLVYRASQQSDILEADDTADPAHEFPTDAKWYIASIFVGRSYEIVIEGDKSRFTTGIKAKLQVFDLGFSKMNERGYLHITAKGRGFIPKQDGDDDGVPDDAMFAKTSQAIEKAYKASGEPMPMYVEYRSIPGRTVSVPEKLEWISEPEPDSIVVERDPVEACRCGNNYNIIMKCAVRNQSGRAMDVTVGATAHTGTMGNNASGATRVSRIPVHGTVTVTVDAHIDGAWMDCASCGNAMCKLSAMYPSQ